MTPKHTTPRGVAALLLLASAAFAAPLRAQAPPSQLELNGFLIWQTPSAITAALGEPYQVERTPDGWTYRMYVFDWEREAYMVFKFPAGRDSLHAVSVQIDGGPGTEMAPFLGLRLGDGSDAVRDALGKASNVSRNEEWNLDFWEYDGRNYSVELNDQGQLSSIQIFGFEGFPEEPDLTVDPLVSFRDAVVGGDLDTLMIALMPDVEIYRDGAIIRYEGRAREALSDAESPVRAALLEAPGSVREFLAEPDVMESAESVMRMFELGGVGFVYQWPAPAPIEEIVFMVHAGRWAAWEIRYR